MPLVQARVTAWALRGFNSDDLGLFIRILYSCWADVQTRMASLQTCWQDVDSCRADEAYIIWCMCMAVDTKKEIARDMRTISLWSVVQSVCGQLLNLRLSPSASTTIGFSLSIS